MPATATIAPASDELAPTAPAPDHLDAPAAQHVEAPAPQHLEALARANRVRLARAALKRAVASDQISVAEVILESRWESESMPLIELLSAQRRWGRTRSRKFLLALRLIENKRVGTLTARQRKLLADQLPGKAGQAPSAEEEARQELERHHPLAVAATVAA